MAQRKSGYARMANDLYATPSWVTDVLIDYIPPHIGTICEPACGPDRKMSTRLELYGYLVESSDLCGGVDFLNSTTMADAIITNPPYKMADEFIEYALSGGAGNSVIWAAMLLPVDFDSAKTRKHLFGQCEKFAQKIVLTKRIVFIERPGAAPSSNHAWFIWDWGNSLPPTIGYEP